MKFCVGRTPINTGKSVGDPTTVPKRVRALDPMRTRWPRALVAAGLLVSLAILALLPAQWGTRSYDWTAIQGVDRVALPLLDPYPTGLKASGSCRDASGDSSKIILQSYVGEPPTQGGSVLKVVAGQSKILVELTSPVEEAQSGAPSVADQLLIGIDPAWGDCDWSVTLADQDLSLVVSDFATVTRDVESTPILFNEFNYFGSDPTSFRIRVDQSSSFDYTFSAWRLLALAGWVALAGMSFLRVLGHARRRSPRSFEIGKRDVFTAIAMLPAIFVTVPVYDDGFVLNRARLVVEDNWSPFKPLVDIYNFGVPNVQGFLYESVLGATLGQLSYLPATRLLSLVFGFATYFVLTRLADLILHPAAGARGPIHRVMAAATVLWAFAWGGSLRPESVTTFLAALTLALSLWVVATPSPGFWLLVAPSTLAGLALATHQTGLFVLGIALPATLVGIRRNFWSVDALPVAAVCGAMVATPILINQNLAVLQRSIADYRDLQSTHSYAPWDEWRKIAHFLLNNSPTKSLWLIIAVVAAAILLCILLVSSARGRWSQSGTTTLLLCSGVLVSSFSQSKWGWQLQVLQIPILFALGVAANRYACRSLPRNAGLILLSVMFGVGVAWVCAPFIPWVTRWSLLVVALVATVLSIAGIRMRNREIGLADWMTVTLVVALSAGALSQFIGDVRSSRLTGNSWSYLSEVLPLGRWSGGLQCGIPGVVAERHSDLEPTERFVTSPYLGMYALCGNQAPVSNGLWEDVRFRLGPPWGTMTDLGFSQAGVSECVDVSLNFPYGSPNVPVCVYPAN